MTHDSCLMTYEQVAEQEDGGAAHAARLAAEVKFADAEVHARGLRLAGLASKVEGIREELRMRDGP